MRDLSTPWVLLRVRDSLYGVPATHVRRLMELPPVTPAPGSPPYVLGWVTIRDQVTPAIDLRSRLGLPTWQEDRTRLLEDLERARVERHVSPDVLAEARDRLAQAMRPTLVLLSLGSRCLGVAVDEVESIEWLKDGSHLTLTRGSAEGRQPLVEGAARRIHSEELVRILSLEETFRGNGSGPLAPSCAEAADSSEVESESARAQSTGRGNETPATTAWCGQPEGPWTDDRSE